MSQAVPWKTALPPFQAPLARPTESSPCDTGEPRCPRALTARSACGPTAGRSVPRSPAPPWRSEARWAEDAEGGRVGGTAASETRSGSAGVRVCVAYTLGKENVRCSLPERAANCSRPASSEIWESPGETGCPGIRPKGEGVTEGCASEIKTGLLSSQENPFAISQFATTASDTNF